tara:strand:+ start:123 stop:557 length:435 start_codon:yes stop_codon:yes gene_type:complete
MNDTWLTMFAELPGLQRQNGLSLKTFEEYLPQQVGTLLPESVQQWPTTVSADGNGYVYERVPSERPIKETDGFALLPTPTVEQGRSLTSGMATSDGRRPGSTGMIGTTLNDVVFLDRLANMNKPLETGNKSLEETHRNQPTIFD